MKPILAFAYVALVLWAACWIGSLLAEAVQSVSTNSFRYRPRRKHRHGYSPSIAKCGRRAPYPDDVGIARMRGTGRDADEHEQEANARLIAAAPELLEALKELVRCNEEWNDSVAQVITSPPTWNDSYLNAARAAIKKAEGAE